MEKYIINDNAIALIKSFEAFVPHPYHGAADVPSLYTIGYGTIKYPPYYCGGKKVGLYDIPITETQASDFLKYEVNHKMEYIAPFITKELNENQFGALSSFAYNVGEQAVKTSTLLKKINIDPNDHTIEDEFLRWCHSNGQTQPGLVRRRVAEAKLYFS